MTDIEKAKRLFLEAGLTFPAIPEEMATRLKKRDKWLFSTREIEMSPYNLQHYVSEVDETHVADYAVLSHSGHGVNSYALQYYLVHGTLQMFLHVGWGGVYMDTAATTATVRECFSLADQIVAAMGPMGKPGAKLDRLRIVGSDFYGSYWSMNGKENRMGDTDYESPATLLAEVLHWLNVPREKRGKHHPK